MNYYFTDIVRTPASMQIVGLLVDIIGAYWLARGFTSKKPADLKNVAYGSANQNFLTQFGMSGNLWISLYVQGIEARIGLVLLVIGFIFQALGALFSLVIPLYAVFIVALLFSVTPLAVSNYFCKPERVAKIHDRDESKHDKRFNSNT